MIRQTFRTALRPLLVGVALTGAMMSPAVADSYVEEAVTLTFDESSLTDHTNAKNVLKSLKIQAKDVCTSIAPITRAEIVDQTCVADVMGQAIAAIDHPVLNAVYADAGYTNRVTVAGLE